MPHCAVFDFDGTLRDGHITMDFKDALFQAGLFHPKEYETQARIFQEHNAGILSYKAWLDQWAPSWGQAFMGFPVEAVRKIAQKVFQAGLPKLYPLASPPFKITARRRI